MYQTGLLLAELNRGNRSAAERLFPMVYQELRALAGGYLRRQRRDHTLQPTALVHEAFLRMVDQTNPQYNDRAHFLAVAATAMRQILINHALKRNALKRGGNRQRVGIDTLPASAHDDRSIVDVLALDEALKRLATVDQRKAKVVEGRFFGGLTMEEIALVLGVSLTTVEGDWRMARAWLSRELSEETKE
jgi:RNA polymerase sigma factor (TIGR02999 family)